MRVRGVFGALALACSTPLCAQSIAVDAQALSSITTRGGTDLFEGTNISAYRRGRTSGGGFEASVTVTSEKISFENGAIALGGLADIFSTTRLSMAVTNIGRAPLAFTSFESLIIPAGMGLFIAGPAPGCTPLSPQACGSFEGDIGFDALERPSDLPPGNLFGTVGFDFRVLADSDELYALSASLGLESQGGVTTIVSDLAAAEAALAGFTLVTDPLSINAIGYAWDATPFVLTLPVGVLQPGETRTITYVSSVFARSFAVAPAGEFGLLPLLSYSSFGDPVSRPGGGGSSESRFAARFAGTGISEVSFGSFTFVYPYFRDGRLYLPLTPIPEPSTWAMLVAGFGVMGVALRRRRALSA